MTMINGDDDSNNHFDADAGKVCYMSIGNTVGMSVYMYLYMCQCMCLCADMYVCMNIIISCMFICAHIALILCVRYDCVQRCEDTVRALYKLDFLLPLSLLLLLFVVVVVDAVVVVVVFVVVVIIIIIIIISSGTNSSSRRRSSSSSSNIVMTTACLQHAPAAGHLSTRCATRLWTRCSTTREPSTSVRALGRTSRWSTPSASSSSDSFTHSGRMVDGCWVG